MSLNTARNVLSPSIMISSFDYVRGSLWFCTSAQKPSVCAHCMCVSAEASMLLVTRLEIKGLLVERAENRVSRFEKRVAGG